MSLLIHWDSQYQGKRPIWDSDQPTSELLRIVAAARILPCRTLELGCGTGSNAVWLARQGFAVAAIDISPAAILHARDRAERFNVAVRFLLGDLRQLRPSGGPFDFVVDCGCFGAMQLTDVRGYVDALRRMTRPGSIILVLTGNDHEPEAVKGPPALPAQRLSDAFHEFFAIVQLRSFRFDAHQGGGKRFLGWSCLLHRKGQAQPRRDRSGSSPGRSIP